MKTILRLSLALAIALIVLPASAQNSFGILKEYKTVKAMRKALAEENKVEKKENGNSNVASESDKPDNEVPIANPEDESKKKAIITNPKDEVALTVSADGETKEKATKIALRSAIEQAYGTFVSANTTILNDELVKDEIATISTGNIKAYEEVASTQLPNGCIFVTLKAVVCISRLVSYAQSKGASTEFAGATFAMNMKMKELNKQNELIVLNNLLEQIKALVPISFDRELTVKDPVIPEKNYKGYKEDDDCTYAAEERASKWRKIWENNYLMEMQISFKYNENTKIMFDLIKSTLKSINMGSETSEYKKIGLSYWAFNFYNGLTAISGAYLRNPITEFTDSLVKIFYDEFTDFSVIDNTGTVSDILIPAMERSIHLDRRLTRGTGIFKDAIIDGFFGMKYRGFMLASSDYYNQRDNPALFDQMGYFWKCPHMGPDERMKWTIKFPIPRDEISKYNSFKVERKNK